MLLAADFGPALSRSAESTSQASDTAQRQAYRRDVQMVFQDASVAQSAQ